MSWSVKAFDCLKVNHVNCIMSWKYLLFWLTCFFALWPKQAFDALMVFVVWQYAFQWRSFDFKIFKPTLGAISEAWNRVSIIAPVKKFGRARLSTDFRGEETWRTSSESICKFSLTYCCFTIKHLRKGSICPTSKFWSGVKCCQDIIKVREWIPHKGPVTKVIPLKLFLDVVPSSM